MKWPLSYFQVNSRTDEISSRIICIFPFILAHLDKNEKSCLANSCRSMGALVLSCSSWRVCSLTCITANPGVIIPNDFIVCTSICIQCSPAGEDNDVVEPAYHNLDECFYEMKYIDTCHLESTAYGWGMFAHTTISPGTALITYTGELISNEMTASRQMVYDEQVSILWRNIRPSNE